MEHPKLRDSKRLLTHEPYPINEIPEKIVKLIGKQFVYMLCVGHRDLTGDDWGNVFAEAIGGEHLQSPVGIADVVFDKMAWSMKTVKTQNPLMKPKCNPTDHGLTERAEICVYKPNSCSVWAEIGWRASTSRNGKTSTVLPLIPLPVLPE